MKKVGIALGGGGAKGLAHVLMLEALDEMDLRPCFVTGTSIGAVIGVIYCSGLSASRLRQIISEITTVDNNTLKEIMAGGHMLKWLNLITPRFRGSGLLKAERFISFLLESINVSTFEELAIPLRVVASDFWTREQVVLDSGELAPAIQASMSLPGIFTPVTLGESVLIDGGAVNPLPFDLLPEACDLTIAIDVIGNRPARTGRLPSLQESVFNTFQIMEKSIIREKMRNVSPDIFIEIEISNIRALEFYKANQVFKQSKAAKERLKNELARRIGPDFY